MPAAAARRTVLQKVRGRTCLHMLPQLVNTGIQVLFHSPPGVLFTFPSQYCPLSVTGEYLALRGGPRSFLQGFPCLAVLRILPHSFPLRLRGFHPLRPAFPGVFRFLPGTLFGSPYPGMLRIPVWALPIPLAATLGITFVFFSSGYLDVSVRRVPPACLWIQHAVRRLSLRGFPHSDTCGSLRMCRSPQLFAAYRVFLRLPVPGHPPCALFCLAIRPAFGAA